MRAVKALSVPSVVLEGPPVDPEQRLLFSASNDATARAWDAKRGKQLLAFGGHEDSVMAVIEMNGTLYTGSAATTSPPPSWCE